MDKTEKKTKGTILIENLGTNYINNQEIRYAVYDAMHEYAAQERDKVRNQAIDDCIEILTHSSHGYLADIVNKLESLKTKP